MNLPAAFRPLSTSAALRSWHARLAALAAALLLAACATTPAPGPTAPPPPVWHRPVSFAALPGWQTDDLAQALAAFRTSCTRLEQQPDWAAVCRDAGATPPGTAAARAFFERDFTPWQLLDGHGSSTGLITGYYEPVLSGSRHRSARYRYPLYGVPSDLLDIDLAGVYPRLKGLRLRGRLEGRRVVPYYSRSEIDGAADPLAGQELLWVDDELDLFFLQIQGSGRIRLDDGTTVRVTYADQNGWPYKALGRYLISHGDIDRADATMAGIKAWARSHPAAVRQALDSNPSYVFFRELPDTPDGPPGALGVPLTAGRAIAVDPRRIPLGAPVFLATQRPDTGAPWQRLMQAQDTGGAIHGPVRADLFFGSGAAAGTLAGQMRAPGEMWVLLPNGIPYPAAP